MGVDEGPSTETDVEEIDEGNGDTEGTELSEVSGLNGQRDEVELNEPKAHPLPDELNRTIEPPPGIDGDKMVEKHERLKPKQPRKKESKKEQLTHKLYNQLIRTLQSDKTREEMKQIQKRLARVEKNTTNARLQQQLGKELLAQVKLMHKRLDKIDNTITRSKSKGNINREKIRAPPRKVTRINKRSK